MALRDNLHGIPKSKCEAPRDNLPWEMAFTMVCVTTPYIFYICYYNFSGSYYRKIKTKKQKKKSQFTVYENSNAFNYPLHMSHFCLAELILNSRIKFDKSTAEAIEFHKVCRATGLRHGSDSFSAVSKIRIGSDRIRPDGFGSDRIGLTKLGPDQ